MRLNSCTVLAVGFCFAMMGQARAADDKPSANDILKKAIEAHGGETELKKLQSSTAKFKGTIHVMGMDLPATGEASSQGADRQRVDIEFEAGGQKFHVAHIFNRDKGWLKINDTVMEMDKDKAAESLEEAHGAWVATLAPLKEKAYTLTVVGDDKVMDKAAEVVLVSRKDRRDIKLFFDKKTHLLLKTEMRVKDEESGNEVTEESFMEDYNDKGLRQAKKITVKRDGKAFIGMEISDYQVDEKFDDRTFGKP